MRDYALTYPQLVRQGISAGLDERELRRLRDVFETAQGYFDGLYRPDGEPHICHMVRTASILLAEGQPLPLIEAALVHATYIAHSYDHSTRPGPGPRLRRRLRRAVGTEVEEIVWTFREIDWDNIGAPETRLRELRRASAMVRSALALHVADDLENHMDLALAYRTDRTRRERLESDGTTIVQVARELGMPTVADELTTVFQESLQGPLPAAVRWDYPREYELPVGTTLRPSAARRFAGRVRRALRLRTRLRALRVRLSTGTQRARSARHVQIEVVARSKTRPRILVTGAGGLVGREIVPLLRQHFTLRLLDVERLRRDGDDEVVRADIRDTAALRRACRDVSAIVHLAAVGVHQPLPDFTTQMMPINIDGTYQVFEAARHTGIGRVVLASSGTVVGAYPVTERLNVDAPVRPSSVYGCTKVFCEALARYYADCHGIAAICLRIGWFEPYDSDAVRHDGRMRRRWTSPRDLAQLIVKSIQSDVRFAVLFAVSDNPLRTWDLDAARATIGYVPEDRAPDRFGSDPS